MKLHPTSRGKHGSIKAGDLERNELRTFNDDEGLGSQSCLKCVCLVLIFVNLLWVAVTVIAAMKLISAPWLESP